MAIKSCPNCKPHAYQDKTYGAGNRVMNSMNNGIRCTVCDKNHTKEIGKKK